MSNSEDKKPESAPAVVGLIKVSDEVLDFSCFNKKKEACAKDDKKCMEEAKSDCELSPREKAILERLKAKEAK
ncbi:hypothetical protein MCFN_00155 [Mycoplasmopsis californica]|uniref:Uncharacterized protein n=1 Tax=Mycoplasmopsis californica TaxID=2113 RepID=A0A059XQB1_9BACT|nr:hypothetical protein [Mycoplasmopsis californica]AIA29210.1 hypothetical protein MCFN_00155 [Mycoplasmopsis californica]